MKTAQNMNEVIEKALRLSLTDTNPAMRYHVCRNDGVYELAVNRNESCESAVLTIEAAGTEAVAERDLDPEHIAWHVEEYLQQIEWDELDQKSATGLSPEFPENNGGGVTGFVLFVVLVIITTGFLAGGLAIFHLVTQL